MAAATFSVLTGVSSCLLLSERLSKTSECPDPGSFQTTASLLRLGALEVSCMPFKSGISTSYSTPALPSKSPAVLPKWGAQCGAWVPHPLERVSTVVIFSHFGSLIWGVCVLPMLHLCPSYLSHSGFLFMSLVVETLSVSLQVVVNNSCSVSVSNFGVSTGRSKLGVLLLLRFDHLLCMCLYI